jgi:hypothetical protein
MSYKIKKLSAEVKTGQPALCKCLRVFYVKGIGVLLVSAMMASMVSGCGDDRPATDSTDSDLAAIAQEAYVYAYPLVTMEYTRRALTNTVEPRGTTAPMGQLVRMREYPDAKFRAVTAPNADTLYTTGWFDVSEEPWIVTVPDMGDRYFLLPMLDGWTDVFSVPGTRTTGGKAQTFAITGPNWHGTLPAGVTEYKSATSLVWLLGRIYCTGTPEDYAAVHALQDKITAQPLSTYGKPYTPAPGTVDPSVDMKTAVREQVNALDGAAFFSLFARLLKTNPPTAADAPMVEKLARLGIRPGADFDASAQSSDVASAIAAAAKPAQDSIMAWAKEGVAAGDNTVQNGWLFTTKTGNYGTNYIQRAYITAIGLGANLPQDAVYPTSEGPDQTTKYNGANAYVMHFAKGELPPVDGFWSLTMYDADYFFVDNALNRYTLSQRDALKPNADGSVDLLIQADSPGPDRESNWLPAPKGDFVLMLRMYWPKEAAPSILDGTWQVPAVS